MAARPLPPPPASPHCLLQRELAGGQLSRAPHHQRSFCHFRLQREHDLYAAQRQGGAAWWPPFYLRRRSAVREVLSAQGLVVALADSGVCAAYDQDSTQPLCFLNVEADEIIRSLFINHLNGTLITVSVFSGGKGACLPACSCSHLICQVMMTVDDDDGDD
jgi:hypothetical protein